MSEAMSRRSFLKHVGAGAALAAAGTTLLQPALASADAAADS